MMIFPPEIFDIIVQYVPKSELLGISTTCSMFNELCHLYKNRLNNEDQLAQAILDNDLFSIIHHDKAIYFTLLDKSDIKISRVIGQTGRIYMIRLIEKLFTWRDEGKIKCDFKFNGESALVSACKHGHMEFAICMITEYHCLFMRYGITAWDAIFKAACIGGNVQLVKLLMTMHDFKVNLGFEGACIGNHVKIAEILIKHMADIDYAVKVACQYDCIDFDILNLLVRDGQTKWDDILFESCYRQKNRIVEYAKSKGGRHCLTCQSTRCYEKQYEIRCKCPVGVCRTHKTLLTAQKIHNSTPLMFDIELSNVHIDFYEFDELPDELLNGYTDDEDLDDNQI